MINEISSYPFVSCCDNISKNTMDLIIGNGIENTNSRKKHTHITLWAITFRLNWVILKWRIAICDNPN